MPRLTVRALAELLDLSAYQQLRILQEQKYPRQEPQVFRAPYYQPALTAIRTYYQESNDSTVLGRARGAIRELRLPSRRQSNLRVLEAFEESSQYKRRSLPIPRSQVLTRIGQLEIRLSLDMMADERGSTRRLYYNCRTAKLEAEIARRTLEIAHWIMEQNGLDVPYRNLEYFDFANGRMFRIASRRPRTITSVRANARIIEALWNTI